MKCKECDRVDIQNKKLGLCSIHYARWYRKNNQDRIRPTKKAYYLKNKQKLLGQYKVWAKKNKEWIKAKNQRQYKQERDLMLIRQKTHHFFRQVIKESKCENCDTTQQLQFHHLKPFAYDNFQILCADCHREAHGRLLQRTIAENGSSTNK